MENKFFKAHSLGNNFILILSDDINSFNSEFIVQINNCFFSIGCNQVLIADLNKNVKIWDEDGTVANLCGNGLRCLAKLFNEKKIVFKVQETGEVILENLSNNLVSLEVNKEAMIKKFDDHYVVNVGNLNKIFFVEDNTSVNIESYANTEYNYSFLSKKYGKWSIRTMESCTKHETKACGSASLASAYAIRELGDDDLTVHYKLGYLSHSIKNNRIIQTGPATIVAEIKFL